MASSRVIWICLLVTICLFKGARSAPLEVEEDENVNEIDFEEENLDDNDDVLKDPDFIPEYDEEWDDDEWEDEEDDFEFEEEEKDSDDKEKESEDDADEESEDSKSQNRRKRDIEDLDGEEEKIDPEIKELIDMESEEVSGINFTLKDRETPKISDEFFLESLDKNKLKDSKYLHEYVNESLDFLDAGDLEKPAFMENMHRRALELLSSISKLDSE